MDSKNDVYIIDSYGLIYRSYFAFITRPLVNSKNENVSAVFGFFRNLINIIKSHNPKYIIAAFDSRTPTFRHEMYPEYKATRDKTPEDLHAQIPVIENLLSTLGVKVLRQDGFEADDIIATVATYCQNQNLGCKILSGDKDLMQLVTTSTTMMCPDKAGGWQDIGIAEVEEKWGVKPELMLDLLSLIGDTADNVPGVKGIGEKTAAKLLKEYGSLDGIYQQADSIKGAMGEKLRNGKESAYFSKELIALKYDVQIDFNPENFSTNNLNYKETGNKLKELGIPSVAKAYFEYGLLENPDDFSLESASVETSKSTKANPEKTDILDGFENQLEKKIEAVENHGEYKAIRNLPELTKLIDLALEKKLVALDTETNSLNTREALLAGFSLSIEEGKGFYIPLRVTDMLLAGDLIQEKDALNQLKRLFDSDISICFHNGKYDLQVLKTAGLDVIHSKAKILDTMIAAWILNPDKTENGSKASFSLEKLAETKLGLIGTEFDSIVKKGQTFMDLDVETATPYAAEDTDFTLKLWNYFEPQIFSNATNPKLKDLFDLEMKILPILTEMEINGIHIEKSILEEYKVELEKKAKSAEKDIYELSGKEFNIASPKQLGTVLFEDLGLPHGKKTKSGYSTDTSVLEELATVHPIAGKLLEYRGMTKLLSTYVETLPNLADKMGRIHTNYIQTGTATGRLSSRDPNLQNIPVRDEAGRKIRSAFVSPANRTLVTADYSQIELVVLAHLSKDENMCKAFTQGIDIHKATAAMIFGTTPDSVTPDMRRVAKTINFGVIYGMSAFRLAKDLNISRTQAQEFMNAYFATYSGITQFMQDVILKAEETGYVETIFGRRRYIYGITSKNKLEKSGAERVAKNTPIQGSAADIVKMAMVAVYNQLKEKVPSAKMLLQVHDELIVECDTNDAEIVSKIMKETMENVIKLDVPLKVSVESGTSWGQFH